MKGLIIEAIKWLLRHVSNGSLVVSPFEDKDAVDAKNEPKAPICEPIIITNREKLYEKAYSLLGFDVTPEDTTPDYVACAETVNKIHKLVFGDEIGGKTSTYDMFPILKERKDFRQVTTPLEGDIIISPTGYGNGKLSSGHVGIMGKGSIIMSNASSTGLFDTKYNLETWKARYKELGGFPVCFFRKL